MDKSVGVAEVEAGPVGGRAGVLEGAYGNENEPRAELYALRMVEAADAWDVLVETHRALWLRRFWRNMRIARPAGDSAAEIVKLREGVAARLAALEDTELPETAFSRNLAIVSRRIGLSPLESELLGVLASMLMLDWFHELTDKLDANRSRDSLIFFLSGAVRVAPVKVRRCLAERDARLVRSGLVAMPPGGNVTPCRFEGPTLCPGLAETLFSPSESPLDFLNWRCHESAPAELGAGDFEHLRDEFDLAARIIRKAVEQAERGVNILIYGPPGTGKTEFVRAVAGAAGLSLWEVGNKDSRGYVAGGQERFMDFRLAQMLLADVSRAALLFDEFEDALVERGVRGPERMVPKAFLNEIVETNNVPTLWVSNSPHAINPATQRRFTHTIEMDRPSRAVNERLLASELAPFGIEAGWAERVAADERLVPAYAKRVRRVLKLAEPEDGKAATRMAEKALEGCVSLTAAGNALPKESVDSADYRLGFLNTDADLRALVRNVAVTGKARLCLEGPPGTGKTAFARYLARRIGRYLMVRRCSDLISPWVGETERQIAQAFTKAERDGAVLLVDELEGFLQARTRARQSWQITEVNEMLTRLESFPGVFVGTTNLADTLEAAARRRFDAFVKFDYLRPAQSLVLLRRMVRRASGKRPALVASQRRRLSAIPNLTPGDFAAVSRRAALFGHSGDVDWWIDALAHDAVAKPDAPKAPPGFLA